VLQLSDLKKRGSKIKRKQEIKKMLTITTLPVFQNTIETVKTTIKSRKALGHSIYIYYPEALYTSVFFHCDLDAVNEELKKELTKLGYKVRIRLDKQLEIAW
jgi:hypothetical protein